MLKVFIDIHYKFNILISFILFLPLNQLIVDYSML